MVDIRKPRKGSMAVRPRKRAKRHVKRVNAWPDSTEKSVLGFAGYKAGMTTVSWVESRQGPRKGMEVFGGATIIEAPPMAVYGVRVLANGSNYDEFSDDNDVMKPLGAKKKPKSSIKEGIEAEAYDVRLLAYAQPASTSTGKKHIERMELGVGGANTEEKLTYGRELLGKQLSVADVIKTGSFVDVVAVTKGKGWQGPVKRFGVSTQRRKATGKVRHVGTLGPFKPGYVQYTAPMPGQMGYHKRTEINKLVLGVFTKEKAEDINPKSGWPYYGVVKNDFIVLKGSIPGPVKRVVRLRHSIRKRETVEPKLSFIDNSSKN
ncbi:MAG: 50S ribosomal protein L3 [Methanobacteriota archaeon]|nr:MAG: 50S ribosomal protein L3 [Euryarchaeota archaeon]